jgi:hypothetical protein
MTKSRSYRIQFPRSGIVSANRAGFTILELFVVRPAPTPGDSRRARWARVPLPTDA